MKTINLSPNSTGCIANHHSVTLPIQNRIAAQLSTWYQAWQQRREWKRDMDHIARFSPYLLRDIGLSAEDVVQTRLKQPHHIVDTIGRAG